MSPVPFVRNRSIYYFQIKKFLNCRGWIFRFALLRWCDVLFWCRKIKRHAKSCLQRTKRCDARGWKRRKIARYTLRCFVNIFHELRRDKLVLMFHSGLRAFVNQLVFHWRDNSSFRLIKFLSPSVIWWIRTTPDVILGMKCDENGKKHNQLKNLSCKSCKNSRILFLFLQFNNCKRDARKKQ